MKNNENSLRGALICELLGRALSFYVEMLRKGLKVQRKRSLALHSVIIRKGITCGNPKCVCV